MIHDELLATINVNLCNREGCDGEHYKKDNLHGEWFALRAVVELHEPKLDLNGIPLMGKFPAKCEICKEFYPCKTIQAIEKELISG